MKPVGEPCPLHKEVPCTTKYFDGYIKGVLMAGLLYVQRSDLAEEGEPFHPGLKNVPHLLRGTTSDHTLGAEAEKRGAPG